MAHGSTMCHESTESQRELEMDLQLSASHVKRHRHTELCPSTILLTRRKDYVTEFMGVSRLSVKTLSKAQPFVKNQGVG